MAFGGFGGWLGEADRRIGVLFAAIAFRNWAAALALIVLCSALYLPGIASLPVTDRDEARFAQASKQMAETGDLVDIRFQNAPRYKKPIGIYWLQAASLAVFTDDGEGLNAIWPYRIPSFIAAILAVLATWWAARPIFGRKTALLAGLLLASCLSLAFEARIAKSDAALLASIALTQGGLFRLYLARPGWPTGRLACLFWLALGAGILIKGPVAPAIALLTGLTLCLRDGKRGWLGNLHWRWGLPLMLLAVLPWFIAIGVASKGEFFNRSLVQDFLGKLKEGKENHWGPPGTYFILFWLTFWPAALFASGGAALKLWRQRHLRRALFLLAWIAPFWLALEATPTKLPHYALPLYPAIAMAAAWILRNGAAGFAVPGRTYKQAAALFCVIAACLFGFLAALLWVFDSPIGPGLIVLLALFLPLAGIAGRAAWLRKANLAVAAVVAASIVLYAAAFRYVLPEAAPFWIARNAARAVSAMKDCAQGTVAFSGYGEPSTVFLNGKETLLSSPQTVADALASGRAAFAFVSRRRSPAFEARYRQATGSAPYRLGCLDGFDLNGGHALRLQAYAAAQRQAVPACAPPPMLRCAAKKDVRWRRVLDTKF
jgi:hypothetical protein